jgi:AmiR/NasT family two-component response regulator
MPAPHTVREPNRPEDRIVLEQANGVLAVRHDIDLSAAYTLLVATAADQHIALVRYAAQVVASVGPGTRVT